MTRRENHNRRRPATRQPRERVLVVCGGTRTEPQYLLGLRQLYRNPAVQVKVVPDGRDPQTMIEAIPRRLQHVAEDFDQVWCVFDVDEFDVENAIAAAARQHTSVAVSNPCFEVWLLLHKADVRTAFADATAVRHALQAALPGFDKTSLDFGTFIKGIADASARARTLHDDPTTCGPNPSSGMWRLVEIIASGGSVTVS